MYTRTEIFTPQNEAESEKFACDFFEDTDIDKSESKEILNLLQGNEAVMFIGDLCLEFPTNVVVIGGIIFGSRKKIGGFSPIDRSKLIYMDANETYISDKNQTFVLMDMTNIVDKDVSFSIDFILYGEDGVFKRENADFTVEHIVTGKYHYHSDQIRVSFKAVEVDFVAAEEFVDSL